MVVVVAAVVVAGRSLGRLQESPVVEEGRITFSSSLLIGGEGVFSIPVVWREKSKRMLGRSSRWLVVVVVVVVVLPMLATGDGADDHT